MIIVIGILIAAAVAFIQVFGKMFIEITDDIDKKNKEKHKEEEFQRHLTESIRRGQRRN